MKRLLAIVFAALVLLSCARPEPAHDVYATVVHALLAQKTEIFLSQRADGRWFRENTLEDYLPDLMRDAGKHWKPEFAPVLARLFEIHREDGTLGWKAQDARVTTLDATHVAKPQGRPEIDAMCLVAGDTPGTIGVAMDARGARQFRPYYTLSKVAFDETGRIAMLKLGYACAPMSGASEKIVVLERVDGVWRIVGAALLWIS